MKILQTHIPDARKMSTSNSFDVAFMALTGHAKFGSPMQAIAEEVMKYKDVVLWGPQSKMLSLIVTKEWQKQSKGLIKALIRSFDLRGDIKVSKSKITAAFNKHKDVGQSVAEDLGPKIRDLSRDLVLAAHRHFTNQRRRLLKTKKDEVEKDAAFDAYMAQAMSDHVDVYLTEFPQRVLHPEIQKLVKMVETNPAMRTIDKGLLKERIKSIGGLPPSRLANATDTHAGLFWQATGIDLAQRYDVKTYIISAIWDRATCPVCKVMDGKTGDVGVVHAKMLRVVGGTGTPEDMIREFPFVRLPQIDNIPATDVNNMDLIAPFHGRCRCDTIFGWRTETATATVEAPRPKKSTMTAPLKPTFNKAATNKAYDAALINAERELDAILAGIDPSEWADISTALQEPVGSLVTTQQIRDAANKIVDKMKSYPDMNHALAGWQASTNRRAPSVMKSVVGKLEKGAETYNIHKTHVSDGWDVVTVQYPNMAKEYIEVRAFNQAYMKRIGEPKSKTLYRGITGKHGSAYRNGVMEAYEVDGLLEITGTSATGWTTDMEIADGFGGAQQGVTLKSKIPSADIIIHPDLMSGVQSAYQEEFEYIVVGRKATYTPGVDIFNGSDGFVF